MNNTADDEMGTLSEQRHRQIVTDVLKELLAYFNGRDADTKKQMVQQLMASIFSIRNENELKQINLSQKLQEIESATTRSMNMQSAASKLMDEATTQAYQSKAKSDEHVVKMEHVINLMEAKVEAEASMHNEVKVLLTTQKQGVDNCRDEVDQVAEQLRLVNVTSDDHGDMLNEQYGKLHEMAAELADLRGRVHLLETAPAIGVPALEANELFPPSPSVVSGTPSAPGSAPPPTPLR